MVWTRMFKISNLTEAMKPIYMNSHWRRAMISGKSLAKIRKVFFFARLPFIYDKKFMNRSANRLASPYNKFPKRFGKKDTHILKRMSKIKIALGNSIEREIKSRQEKINKRPPVGIEAYFKELMPYFIKPQKMMKAQTDEKKHSKKKLAEYVKGIPKSTNQFRRTEKEKLKLMFTDGIMSENDYSKDTEWVR